jgi:hypothetical protein
VLTGANNVTAVTLRNVTCVTSRVSLQSRLQSVLGRRKKKTPAGIFALAFTGSSWQALRISTTRVPQSFPPAKPDPFSSRLLRCKSVSGRGSRKCYVGDTEHGQAERHPPDEGLISQGSLPEDSSNFMLNHGVRGSLTGIQPSNSGSLTRFRGST